MVDREDVLTVAKIQDLLKANRIRATLHASNKGVDLNKLCEKIQDVESIVYSKPYIDAVTGDPGIVITVKMDDKLYTIVFVKNTMQYSVDADILIKTAYEYNEKYYEEKVSQALSTNNTPVSETPATPKRVVLIKKQPKPATATCESCKHCRKLGEKAACMRHSVTTISTFTSTPQLILNVADTVCDDYENC